MDRCVLQRFARRRRIPPPLPAFDGHEWPADTGKPRKSNNYSEPAQALRDDLPNGYECPSDRSHERRGATPTAAVWPECAAASDSRRRRRRERSVAGESDPAKRRRVLGVPGFSLHVRSYTRYAIFRCSAPWPKLTPRSFPSSPGRGYPGVPSEGQGYAALYTTATRGRASQSEAVRSPAVQAHARDARRLPGTF